MVHVRRLSLWIAVLALALVAVLAVHGQPSPTSGPDRSSAAGGSPSGRLGRGPASLDRLTATHAGPDDGSSKVRTPTWVLGAAFAALAALLIGRRTPAPAGTVVVRRRPTGPWRGRAPPAALPA
ncbi:hypothetical protein [Aquihabitans sp. McL0605]|uniref:hypothetical protein n=1 Tax=Aquihabitans sp. McL0605 TaxID=3415671 RepID=UPI003CEC5A6E